MTAEELSKAPMVYVKWIDAGRLSTDGWSTMEDLENHAANIDKSICYSVGFIYKETEHYLYLVSHIVTEYDNIDGDMAIPKVAILDKRLINHLHLPPLGGMV